jgi:hypothetical protein
MTLIDIISGFVFSAIIILWLIAGLINIYVFSKCHFYDDGKFSLKKYLTEKRKLSLKYPLWYQLTFIYVEDLTKEKDLQKFKELHSLIISLMKILLLFLLLLIIVLLFASNQS